MLDPRHPRKLMGETTGISWCDATFNPVMAGAFDQAAYMRDYRVANRERIREQVAAGRRRSTERALALAYVRGVKEATPCADCAGSYPHYVMDFDHVREVKDASIADLARNGCGLERIKREIEKCEIVCSNCHRTRTWVRLRAEEAMANG